MRQATFLASYQCSLAEAGSQVAATARFVGLANTESSAGRDKFLHTHLDPSATAYT